MNKKEIVVPVINDEETLKKAVLLLSDINRYSDELKVEKEAKTKPLNEVLRKIREEYKPEEEKIEKAVGILRANMSAYQNKLIANRKIEEEKVSKALQSGKIDMDKAMTKLAVVGKPVDKVKTSGGEISFIEKKNFRVVDVNKLPREYMIVNESLIRKKMGEGVEIVGVEYFIEQVVRNYR